MGRAPRHLPCCSSSLPLERSGCPLRWCRAGGRRGGTQGFRWSGVGRVGRSGAGGTRPPAGWGSRRPVEQVGPGGAGGAEWGHRSAPGRSPPPAGAAWRRGRASGGVPRGRGGPPGRWGCSGGRRDRAAGKAAGARPVEPRGRRLERDVLEGPGAAGEGPGMRAFASITTASASPRSPGRRRRPPVRPRRPPSWRRPRSRSGCPHRRRPRRGPARRTRAGSPGW